MTELSNNKGANKPAIRPKRDPSLIAILGLSAVAIAFLISMLIKEYERQDMYVDVFNMMLDVRATNDSDMAKEFNKATREALLDRIIDKQEFKVINRNYQDFVAKRDANKEIETAN